MKLMVAIGALLGLGVMIGCGSDTQNQRADKRTAINTPPNEDEVIPRTPSDGWIVKASHEIAINSYLDTALSLSSKSAGDHSTEISVTIPKAQQFEADASKIVFPETIEFKVQSIGQYEITKLLDNDLDVCGEDGSSKCTEAAVRIYSKETAGDGLWNEAGAYGAPITTGESTILLGEDNAATLATYPIPETDRNIKLTDLTGGKKSLKIPLKVDFSLVGSGTFTTTLQVDYVVR